MKGFLLAPYRQLYYLQLENYELSRFLRLVMKSFSAIETRTALRWTPKIMAVTLVACGLSALFVVGAIALLGIALGLLALMVVYGAFFAPLAAAVLILSPLDALAKRSVATRASLYLRKFPRITVIAIAGSYGKTTMKHVLAEVLQKKKKVVVTPDSFNTPLGISRTILHEVSADTDVLILELGEHYPGDLAFLTGKFPPDITIVTGINEAHLERFKTMEALTKGIGEAMVGTKSSGLIVLNADSEQLMQNFATYVKGQEIAFFSSHSNPKSTLQVSHHVYHSDGTGQGFALVEKGIPQANISISLLGGYTPGIASAVFMIGRRLGLTASDVEEGLALVKPVPHRLEPIRTNPSVLVIDDSYNGNPEGVRHAIETLARFKERRKVYVTPGLVEGGVRTVGLHKDIGASLAKVADIVVLIRNSVTPYIEGGLLAKGFKKGHIYWFDTAADAHAHMKEIVRPGDVVLFQNDWPDNYL